MNEEELLAVEQSKPPKPKIIEVSHLGNLGNHMIQYMTSLALLDLVPGGCLSRIHLPEWGIQIPPIKTGDIRTEVVTEAIIPMSRLAKSLNSDILDRIDIRSYAQQIVNFGPLERYKDVFHSPDVRGTGAGELLCNIRQGDIINGKHPDYILLPPEFYADLVAQTGLLPVFHGQLEDTPYIRTLRLRFPCSRFLPSMGAVKDFAFIRSSRHIVPSVSTFSWLAAWLSDAESIHFPVVGLFNPAQSRSTNLLPLDDPRYRFIHFPFHYAVSLDNMPIAHASIRQLWRLLPSAKLRALLSKKPSDYNHEAALSAFDEHFYLKQNPDIAKAVEDLHFPSGRHHYEHFGMGEQRAAFEVDRSWYCTTYPIAAMEMAFGEAWDPYDHWLRFGRLRGYRRTGTF